MKMSRSAWAFPLLFLLLAAGCSSSNSDAPPTESVHPQGWLVAHANAPDAGGDASSCRPCHGTAFEGSGKAVSCFNCHLSGPPFSLHPSWWNGDANVEHRHFHNEADPTKRISWTTCAASLCHGPILRGGSGTAPSCFSAEFTTGIGAANSCHAAGPPAPHQLPYTDPDLHGADAKDTGGINESMGNYCIYCHGRPTFQFDGGFVADPDILNNGQANCSQASCHPDAAAHPSNWVRADNSLRFHSTVSAETTSGSCALCHNTLVPGPGPFADAPSCFSSQFTNANALTTGCHPTGPGGAEHTLPFTDPALHGPVAKADLAACRRCHATAEAKNPRFNIAIGNLLNGCEDCHAPGTAHPVEADRWTFNDDLTSTRRTHFASGNVLAACALCHNVSAGDTGGNATACTGCHVSAPLFELKCTVCHLSPPAGAADDSGATTPVDHGNAAAIPLHEDCAVCHGAHDGGSGTLTVKASDYQLFDAATPALSQGGDHLDGRLEMNGPGGIGAGYNSTNYGCDSACHSNDTGHRFSNASGLTVEFGNYGTGSAPCDTCHGHPPDGNGDATGAIPVNHLFGDLGTTLRDNHNDCLLCHGTKDDGTGSHSPAANYNVALDHGTGSIDMNSATGYDANTFGCNLACHGNDAAHRLSDSALPVALDDYGSAACSACHDTGVGGAPIIIQNVTSHAALSCEGCHTAHGQGTVIIPDFAPVGIAYGPAHGNGISLGGTATSGQTEAEICWNCHAGASGLPSEWGIGSDTNGSAPDYNHGTLNQANWVGATWTSGTPLFAYKTGLVASTHSANQAVLSAGVDTVGAIRCSYCHDVHNVGAQGFRRGYDNGGRGPYLVGTWMGNPYPEDGAPLAGSTYPPTLNQFGAVPRGARSSNVPGGYQIDQNNGNPTSGWTADASAGLCEYCHGDGDGSWSPGEIDNLNQFGTAGPDAAWIGSNGHSNAVLGGSGGLKANIFRNSARSASPILGGESGAGNPIMAYRHTASRGYGFRSTSGDPYGWNLSPRMNSVARPYGFAFYDWGATVDENTVDAQFHKFSCSKCHDPHASRLPRLMITNCLDTKHNTWDTTPGVNRIPTTPNTLGTPVSPENRNTNFSNATSAQNCHRLSDPAQPQAKGSGWNRVTPWGAGGGTASDNGLID